MNIYESITAIMEDGYSINKGKRNQQQGFMYRGIDDVMNTFYPLLSKYKVFVVPEVLNMQREERQTTKGGNLIYSILTIRYTFFAEDGSSVSAVVIGEGMDSGDKASNKALAIGMKYALFQTFCIPTEDMRRDDPDGNTPEPSTPKLNPVEPPPGAPEYKAEAPKEATKEEAPKADKPVTFRCMRCDKTLKPIKRQDGSQVSVRQWDEFTNRHYGQSLCWSCTSTLYPDFLNFAAELK